MTTDDRRAELVAKAEEELKYGALTGATMRGLVALLDCPTPMTAGQLAAFEDGTKRAAPSPVGHCKECLGPVYSWDEIAGHPGIYDCPKCGHPNGTDELFEPTEPTPTPDAAALAEDNDDSVLRNFDALRDTLRSQAAEIERLKRGDFTPEEFQNLCHNRHADPMCTPEDFFAGCAEYQRKLFGGCDRDRLRAELAACRAATIEECAKMAGVVSSYYFLNTEPRIALIEVAKRIRAIAHPPEAAT
jgi:hypothetical protein